MINERITKAVIPCAGLGTRFLPATKAQPKEMLPIVDKPTLQYIVEEAVKSGITDILIVTGRNKKSIEDHFDKSVELEMELEKKGKDELLKVVQDISNLVNIHYIRQKEPKGLGHAILCAKSFVGNEPFAVMLGDDIVKSDEDGTPALKQLIDAYGCTEGCVLGVQNVPFSEVSKYGIVNTALDGHLNKDIRKVHSIVEKPKESSSTLAVLGRYILTPEIFDILEDTEPGVGNEIQLTDALSSMIDFQDVYTCRFKGTRYDVGDKFGYIKATIDHALENPDINRKVFQYLRQVVLNTELI